MLIKVPHWYVVQVSDTTMLPKAAFLPGQQIKMASYEAIKTRQCLVVNNHL